MEAFILRYGVVAIFLGAGIEGEPFAIAGDVLAHRHGLSPAGSVPAAIVWGALFTGPGWLLGPGFEAAEARYGTGIAGWPVAVSVLVLALRRGRE